MRSKKMVVILAIVMGLFIFLAILTVLQDGSSGAKKVRDQFVADVLAGKSQETYALLASETKNTETIEAWQSKVNRVSAFMGEGQPKLIDDGSLKSEVADKSYQATYEIKGTDGDYTMSVVMIEEKEGWRVLVFNTDLK